MYSVMPGCQITWDSENEHFVQCAAGNKIIFMY